MYLWRLVNLLEPMYIIEVYVHIPGLGWQNHAPVASFARSRGERPSTFDSQGETSQKARRDRRPNWSLNKMIALVDAKGEIFLARERRGIRPGVVRMVNDSAILMVSRAGGNPIRVAPHCVMMDSRTQPVMICKKLAHELRLTADDLVPCPFTIVISIGHVERATCYTRNWSSLGLEAVLTQKDDFCREYVVVYASRSNNMAKANYSSYERETLAAVRAIACFRLYLYGQHFILVTDHQPLRWFMESEKLTGKLARWDLLL